MKRVVINKNANVKKGGRKIKKMTENEFALKAKEFILKVCSDEDRIKDINSVKRILGYLPYAIRQAVHLDKNSQIAKDFKGITPDWENYDMIGNIRTVNGAPYITMDIGGDWESPLLVMIYHDGKQFRLYVPTKGNAYRKDTKQLFGNCHGTYDQETRTYTDTLTYKGKVYKSDDKYIFDELVKQGDLDKEKDIDKKSGLVNKVSYDLNMCIEDFSDRVEVIKESVNVHNTSNKKQLYENIMKNVSESVKNILRNY